MAKALRPLPGHLLRARQDARFTHLRGSPGPAADARPRSLHRALRAAPRGLGRGERAVHAAAPEAGRPLADPARPHIERPEVKGVWGRLPAARPPMLLTAAVVLMSAGSRPQTPFTSGRSM